jgi:hypothetical protein
VLDTSPIVTSLGTAIAVVGLFVILEKRLLAAIRFGKNLAAELAKNKTLNVNHKETLVCDRGLN